MAQGKYTPPPMEIPSLDQAKGKFSFQGQKVLLTYKTHIPKDELIAWLTIQTGVRTLKFARAAHESGDENHPYEHTHVLLDIGKSWRCRDARRLDIEIVEGERIHPNWQPIKTPTHWRNAVKYLAKEDPANADLVSLNSSRPDSVIASVWAQPTLQEALLTHARTFNEVPGIIAAYQHRPREVAVATPNHPWQEDVLTLLEHKPDTRSIHWFYDPVGNTGKSHLARYLMANKSAYVVKQCGGSYHFSTIVQNALASGWNEHCMIFDLPRSAEQQAIYAPIEEVKDGCVTALKYQGGTLLFEHPHVLVFANFLPNRSALSEDRWRIHTICRESLTLDKALSVPDYAAILNEVCDTKPAAPEELGDDGFSAPSGSDRDDNVLSDYDVNEILGELGQL